MPANLKLKHLHNLMQSVFSWKDYHLYDFSIINSDDHIIISRLVPNKEDWKYDDNAILISEHTLDEFFPIYKNMIYTYDMGENWEHEIQLIRVIEEHQEESPYLLEAKGQAPPEDVGGIPGFLRFLQIMQNPNDPEYEEVKTWARYWMPDLWDYETKPKVLHL